MPGFFGGTINNTDTEWSTNMDATKVPGKRQMQFSEILELLSDRRFMRKLVATTSYTTVLRAMRDTGVCINIDNARATAMLQSICKGGTCPPVDYSMQT